MLLGLALLFLRAPKLLLDGRVYAEEGTTYLHYAWDATAKAALLAPHQGYYSLLVNVVTFLPAHGFPLEWAALLFTWSAAAAYLFMLYLAVTSVHLQDWRVRLAAVVALCLVTPNYEVWLTLEDVQFVLPVCCGILLTESAARRSMMQSIVLIVSGLTCITSCVLTPLFWFRWYRQRTMQGLLQAAILSAASLVQLAVVFRGLASGTTANVQHHLTYIGPMLVARVFIHHFLPKGADVLYDRALADGGLPLQIFLLVIAVVLVWALFRLAKAGEEAGLLLVTAAMMSFGLSWYGCALCDLTHAMLTTRANGRYFFACNALVTFALLVVISRTRVPRARQVAWIAIAASIGSGSIHYVRDHSVLVDYTPWKPQVAAWRQDPSHRLVIAPDWWTVRLSLTPQPGNVANLPANMYDTGRVK